MIFKRQRLLLSLLDALDGQAERMDFQKLLMLYCREWEDTPSYEFVPHRFGAFSFTSHADLRKLSTRGMVIEKEHTWSLTAEGRGIASEERDLRSRVGRFAKNHTLRGDSLVAETYRRYPWYATRSEIANRVLANDPQALASIVSQRPSTTETRVSTIGYEGRSLEAYLEALLRAGVTLLCDVRRNPLSRKYGFSKGALSTACRNLDVRYEHLPELGIESSSRQDLTTQADYDELFATYTREHLPRQTAALETIRGWADGGERIALTCFEAHPKQCHRHCVANALVAKFGNGYAPRHL